MSIKKELTYLSVAVAISCLSVHALAQAKPKLTVGQALSLLTALRNFDGHQVVVATKDARGQDVNQVIMQPWDFGSGLLRLKVTNDITILTAVDKIQDDARQTIVKEIWKGSPPKEGAPKDTPEMTEFTRQYGEVLNGPAQGSDDLARIKASELKLDKNEMPVTVLSALQPILDLDVDLK